jgi:hypothetical protein
MASSTRTNGSTRLQHEQRETGVCLGSARKEAAAIEAGPIEAAPASQGRTRGLGVGVMEDIQVRDDDDARAGAITGTSPDVIGIGMFWMPERDSCFPLSNAAELEPEGRDTEVWMMGSDVPSNTSVVSWGATAAWVLDCGVPGCHVGPGVLIPQVPPQSTNFNKFPLSNMGPGPAESDDEGWVLRVYAPSSGSVVS